MVYMMSDDSYQVVCLPSPPTSFVYLRTYRYNSTKSGDSIKLELTGEY